MSLTEAMQNDTEASTAPTERSPSANGLKRRQSECEAAEQEQESKRQRVSPGKSSPIPSTTNSEEKTSDKRGTPTEVKAKEETSPRQARKRSVITDEKQRSRRLFGALLGAPAPSDRVSKRRQEIESRRKAELQRQDDERLEDKQRRIEQLFDRRKKEQKTVDEHNMRIRHSNILNAANFLQTFTEPKLYYRPWELRADEEDRIDEQIKEAKALIENELAGESHGSTLDADMESRHDIPLPEATEDRVEGIEKPADDDPTNEGSSLEQAGTEDKTGDSMTAVTTEQVAASVDVDAEHPAEAKADGGDPPAKPAEVPESSPATNHNGVVEEDGGHVVENDEDTIVY